MSGWQPTAIFFKQKQKMKKLIPLLLLCMVLCRGCGIAFGQQPSIYIVPGNPGRIPYDTLPLQHVLTPPIIYDNQTPTYDTIPIIICYIDTAWKEYAIESVTDEYKFKKAQNILMFWMKGYEVRKKVYDWYYDNMPPLSSNNFSYQIIGYMDENKHGLPSNLIVILTK